VIRTITLLLRAANMVLASALSVPITVSGYEDWIGVLRDADATGPSRQFTLYSVLARDAIALGVVVATTIFAWEQEKRQTPQVGRLVTVLALLLAAPVIYILTH
jgi:heme/copper-type cytochrome/quinol oxidase subunit 2